MNKKYLVVMVIITLIAVGIWTVSMKPRSEVMSRKPIRIGTPKDGRVEKSPAEWKAILPANVFSVARNSGTERAFTGATWDNHAEGKYRCACCDQVLFESSTKFDSGTGWPSFWQPVDDSVVSLFEDRDMFSIRVEVTCSRCDAHLGHVFEDGPRPTGLRYCMNSAAMTFVPK